MKLIITCGCGDTTQFAKDAFKIAFPNEELPEIYEKIDQTQMDDLNKIIVSCGGEEIDFSKPYALEVDDSGYNGSIYDLLKGYKIC